MKMIKMFDEIKDTESIDFLRDCCDDKDLIGWVVLSDIEIDENFNPVYDFNEYQNRLYKHINHKLIELGANIGEYVIITIY